MPELDPLLQVELLKWREELRHAEESGSAVAGHVRDRTVRVFVRTSLDDTALADLGLRVSSRIGNLVIAEIALRDAERAASAPGVEALAPDQPLKPQLDGSVPQINAPSVWNGTPGFKGRNVVLGMIDTGVDIFHDSFRQADRTKSRIISIWDQTASGGLNPAGFGYGVEYGRGQIEAALAIDVSAPGTATFPHTDGQFVGGTRVETGGHGTHVLSIAAGDGSPVDTCDFPFTFVGVAPEADLVVVSAVGRGTFLVEAIQYIFNVAAGLTPPRPAVVNISLGWNLGARDGSDLMDSGIDGLLSPVGVGVPGRAVVVAAGNDGQKRRHARKAIAGNGTARLDFLVEALADYPLDISQDDFDIWFDGAATLTLTIDGPAVGGVVSQVIPAAGGTFPISGNNVTVSSAVVESNGQKHIRVNIAASAAAPVAMGSWAFRFQETSNNPATIDVWIDREDTDVHPVFSQTDAVRENTVTLPGTCQSVITVGSYDPDRFLGLGDFDLSDFSSWGLQLGDLAPGQRMKPDIAAPGQKICAAASGVARKPPACCRCCNYLHTDMQGTSMAAPHVAGVVALMFQKHPQLTCEQARSFLQLGASLDSIPVAERPTLLPEAHGGGALGTPGQPDFKQIHQNSKWGSGRLDALAAVNLVVVVGGGGGGGGTIDSSDPAPESFAPRFDSIAWPQQFAGHPAFHLFAALVSTHVDEVRRLIDTNKRVAVVWRRGGGPAILRHLLDHYAQSTTPLPSVVGEYSASSLIDRLMTVFARFGSEALRSDVVRWRDFLLAVPGSDLQTLDARLEWPR